MATAILVDATVARMLLVPAIMQILAGRAGGYRAGWIASCRPRPVPAIATD
jgi:uncharacterized membrane protein YdfJ with MMPL/SSD domain